MDERDSQTEKQAKWQPIHRIERRVVGVLIEKAKTTPNAYPLTLNALTTGCNQKSNRFPEMNLEPVQVEDALEHLRKLGAAAEIAGGGRVPKYRHYMYEWLGVEKEELAIMAELLLRGGQTVGELRGRAARMDPIADLTALKPLLQSLMDKGLIVSLTPEGRGQIVTHALFQEDEMSKEQARLTSAASAPAAVTTPPPTRDATATPLTASSSSPGPSDSDVDSLRQEVAELRAEMSRLKSEIEDIWSSLQ